MYLRAVLKRHGDGVSVDTSHEETEETPYSQELLESSSVDGSNLEKTQDDHVKNHGPLSTELIASHAKPYKPVSICLTYSSYMGITNIAAPTERRSSVRVMAVEIAVFEVS